MLEISKIKIDEQTQSRVALNQDTVKEYAQAMLDGVEFPAITVFFDGVDYWLADGYHRYFAAKEAGFTSILEHVTPGTKRDAILFSVGANATHGLRRTNVDKRKAVLIMLKDGEWSAWSDNQIAKQCGVHHSTVGEYRRSLAESASDDQKTTQRTYTTKHGTQATMQVSNIGKKEDAPHVEASKEEVIEAPEYIGADDDELQNQLADLEIYYKLLEEDDKLKAATDTIKQLEAENRALRLRLNGLMSEKDEAIKLVKSKQRQIDKLEKERAHV